MPPYGIDQAGEDADIGQKPMSGKRPRAQLSQPVGHWPSSSKTIAMTIAPRTSVTTPGETWGRARAYGHRPRVAGNVFTVLAMTLSKKIPKKMSDSKSPLESDFIYL